MQELILHTLPAFLLVLGVVVFVHEWGHYIVAKLCGVKIESFSLGFGPEVAGFNDKAGTRWRFSLLPLGGYVKMFGDADPSSSQPDEKVFSMTESEKKQAFFYKSVGQRAAIVAAGPIVNLLFTFVVFVGLFITQGQSFTSPRIGEVVAGSPAAIAGIQPGDTFLKVGAVEIIRFEDIRREISVGRSEPIQVTLERGGSTIETTIVPKLTEIKDRFGGVHQVSQIGVRAEAGKMTYKKLEFVPAIGAAGSEMVGMTSTTLKAIGQIIAGTRGTEELGGPLRIAEMSGKIGKEGIVPLIWFMAVISLSLGLFNLFPIPLLDGGHLFFYAIEAIKGTPVHEGVMEATSRVGFFFIIGMMLFFTWNDLNQLHIVSYVKGLFS